MKSKPQNHDCDAHSINATLIIRFGGVSALVFALATAAYVFTALIRGREPSALVLQTLAGTFVTVMMALIALLGRVGSSTPENPASKVDATIVNRPDEPVPVEEKG